MGNLYMILGLGFSVAFREREFLGSFKEGIRVDFLEPWISLSDVCGRVGVRNMVWYI